MNEARGETLPTTFKGISLQLGYVYNSFIALSCLNIFLAITAFLGNTLIFLALGRRSCLHAPSRLLIRCLTFTDLCVGLVTQPLAALHAISILTEHLQIYQFTVVSSYCISAILSGVSLFILTFISVDRLLALSLGVRYRQTVTIQRVRVVVVFIWAVNIANGTSLLSGKKFYFYILCLAGILLCVVISTFCYGRICHTLRTQKIKVQAIFSQRKSNESSPLHIERYKKTVSSALWVHLTLLACYLPYSVVSGMKAITGETFAVAEGFTATLIFFNSSLNPVLYCWRIKEVRQAVKQTIKQYCGFSSEAQTDINEETPGY
ncbi:histamine H2 receptor-like [Oculina patagonica]